MPWAPPDRLPGSITNGSRNRGGARTGTPSRVRFDGGASQHPQQRSHRDLSPANQWSMDGVKSAPVSSWWSTGSDGVSSVPLSQPSQPSSPHPQRASSPSHPWPPPQLPSSQGQYLHRVSSNPKQLNLQMPPHTSPSLRSARLGSSTALLSPKHSAQGGYPSQRAQSPSPMPAGSRGASRGPSPMGSSPGRANSSVGTMSPRMPTSVGSLGMVPSQSGLAGIPLDTTGDGLADCVGYDTNGDGFVDALDTTGNGVIDTLVPTLPATLNRDPLEENRGRCPAGHLLCRFAVRGERWLCSACGSRQSSTSLFSCRLCNYDSCSDCTLSMDDARAYRASQRQMQEKELRAVYDHLDADGDGSISMLEFVGAIQRDRAVAELVAPGVRSTRVLDDEDAFDACSAAFAELSGGKKRIDYETFAAHLREETSADGCDGLDDARVLFDLMDNNKSRSVSKLELLGAVRDRQEVAGFFFPGGTSSNILDNQNIFDVVTELFEDIACTKKRFEWPEFVSYYRKVVGSQVVRCCNVDRSQQRALVIEIGFGRRINPLQSEVLQQAGYQIRWCQGLPNPEQPAFPVNAYVPQIKAMIDEFNPHIIISASKGGAYLSALWQMKFWSGPSLMINAHPSAQQLPQGVTVVVAHGSNDEVYTHNRGYVEKLISTGSPNRCLLYYTADSGPLPTGQRTRDGDTHNQASLCWHDCLPRLIDAAVSGECPEMNLMRSWRDRLSPERLQSECWLGYTQEQLCRFWASEGRRGRDKRKLFEVLRGSEEFSQIVTIFKAAPKEKAAYCGENHPAWLARQVLRIERVENGAQEDGCYKPYFESLKKSIADQGLAFEPGLHTCWAFHGTDAIDAIVNNPIAGFQPLASGTRGASLWGSGTYLARDAKYVGEGGFCKPLADGSYRMLMCLLTIGMPCLGDPQHHGVLPVRQGVHHYNSSVDFLSNPEIFILQHPGAVIPAYVIYFL